MSARTVYLWTRSFLTLGVIYGSIQASGDGAVEDLILAEKLICRQITQKPVDESNTPFSYKLIQS